MKLKVMFAPRRDGSYGRVVNPKGAPKLSECPSYPVDESGVVEVPDDYAQHLISTGNFVAVDGQEQKPAEDMLITNGDTTINLMELDKPELLAIAKEMNLDVDGRSNVQTLCAAIYVHANKIE